MANMINGNIPLRFGLVPILETEDGKECFPFGAPYINCPPSLSRHKDGSTLILPDRKTRSQNGLDILPRSLYTSFERNVIFI